MCPMEPAAEGSFAAVTFISAETGNVCPLQLATKCNTSIASAVLPFEQSHLGDSWQQEATITIHIPEAPMTNGIPRHERPRKPRKYDNKANNMIPIEKNWCQMAPRRLRVRGAQNSAARTNDTNPTPPIVNPSSQTELANINADCAKAIKKHATQNMLVDTSKAARRPLASESLPKKALPTM
mmetsp:Transcript_69858/g.186037  ORF Transcript_69858/g.186037 Transcript_69858/m.186037 type:complete len:182 (+) Transcript_69858:917-1462(+)